MTKRQTDSGKRRKRAAIAQRTGKRPKPKRDDARQPVRPRDPARKPRDVESKHARGKVQEAPADPAPSLQAVPSSDADDVVEADPNHATFPIVGIGASAGGLDALERFLQHVPAKSGAAYIVVSHLHPEQKDRLPELLRRSAQIPVEQATDGAAVLPDHCYVIPPGNDMSVTRGRLFLLPQTSPRGLHLPIDFFFRSLAEDQAENAVGVILSGMGSDGTLGIRAIKERAGAVFVQSLDSAKFDGMPRSAIDTGSADVVAPVEELPARISSYREHARGLTGSSDALENKAQAAFAKVFVLLRAQTGNDFFLYKRSTIQRRVARRMGLHQIADLPHYVRYLRENPHEIDLLFKELLIGVTNFFRDPDAWEHFKYEAIPALLAKRKQTDVLRAWVPGCSTGEEAYTLAMMFREAVEPFKPVRHLTLQIFATDLDRDAIEHARQGLYPDNIAADVSPERLRKFFVQEERGYRVGKEIREMVVFASQNIIMDPPFTKLDIVSCRNLLIYLSGELQKKLIPLFHYSLKPDGVLFLGSAETVGSFTHLFASIDNRSRLYRKINHALTNAFEFPSAFTHSGSQPNDTPEQPAPLPPASNLERLADRVLVQRFSPLGVLCNDRGDVLYISGRAGKYLEPAVGKANLNIFAMARDGLRHELSNAFLRAIRDNQPITVNDITVGTNGGRQLVDLSVQRLHEPRELRGTMMVVIADVRAAPPAKAQKPKRTYSADHKSALEEQLQRTRDEIQTTREEMQTSQEELKSTNEELQSANEELQSTNEELTTSKEEMQSLNEELQTVNHELQSKVEELSRSNNDMKNLLNSTDIATLFLDSELRVRRFTTPTSKIIKLIASDAGRLITDIASDLDYDGLAADAREVLRTLMSQERQCATRDGRWFIVRVMPYRTVENVIDGVVITFTDATPARALEASLREQASQLQQMAESLPTLVWGCRADGSCDYVNQRWIEYTGMSASEHLGYGWLDQVHPAERERARDLWRSVVAQGSNFEAEMQIRSARGGHRWCRARAVPIRDERDVITRWYGTATDVDDLKRGLGDSMELLEAVGDVVEGVREGMFVLDTDRNFRSMNATAAHLFGSDRNSVIGRNLFDVVPALRETPVDGKIRNAIEAQVNTSLYVQLEAPAAGRYEFRFFILRRADGIVGMVKPDGDARA